MLTAWTALELTTQEGLPVLYQPQAPLKIARVLRSLFAVGLQSDASQEPIRLCTLRSSLCWLLICPLLFPVVHEPVLRARVSSEVTFCY